MGKDFSKLLLYLHALGLCNDSISLLNEWMELIRMPQFPELPQHAVLLVSSILLGCGLLWDPSPSSTGSVYIKSWVSDCLGELCVQLQLCTFPSGPLQGQLMEVLFEILCCRVFRTTPSSGAPEKKHHQLRPCAQQVTWSGA